MSLTNPINKSNLVDRFNALVTNEVNANIEYNRSNKPFPEAPNSWFGGSGGYPSLSPSVVDTVTPEVTASAVASAFIDWTRQMTRIRNARMRLQVTGGGGNRPAGPRPGPAAPAYAEDVIGIAYLSSGYTQTLPSVQQNDVGAGLIITRNGLDGTLAQNPNFGGAILQSGFMQNLLNGWEQRKGNLATLPTATVCHASCHASCHGARGRR